MNVELLKQIRSGILREPTQLNMDHWLLSTSESSCGTTGCIAGWATCLSLAAQHEEKGFERGYKWLYSCSVGVGAKARQLLELDHMQGERLFYVARWPQQFKEAYQQADYMLMVGNKCGYAMRAKATADRIQFFIDTNGTDQITSK